MHTVCNLDGHELTLQCGHSRTHLRKPVSHAQPHTRKHACQACKQMSRHQCLRLRMSASTRNCSEILVLSRHRGYPHFGPSHAVLPMQRRPDHAHGRLAG